MSNGDSNKDKQQQEGNLSFSMKFGR